MRHHKHVKEDNYVIQEIYMQEYHVSDKLKWMQKCPKIG